MMQPEENDGNKQKAHDIIGSRKFHGKDVGTKDHAGEQLSVYDDNTSEKLKGFVWGFFGGLGWGEVGLVYQFLFLMSCIDYFYNVLTDVLPFPFSSITC